MLDDTHTGDKLEWTQIECGENYTVGITKNGKIFTFGWNRYKTRVVPTQVESLDELVITKISCGAYHSAALTDKGEILTWYVRSS